MPDYDALLLVSFGGPEGPDDVEPFLKNVTQGKNVPPERLAEVARHYELFNGVSPINTQNRALLAALVNEFRTHQLDLPIYWGNRHWHPRLVDTLREMADDGVRRALAFVTSAFGSPPGCRQYREAIEAARAALGIEAPEVDKLRLFFNHPGFIEAVVDRVTRAFEQVPEQRRTAARLVYTAHSLPVAMAETCRYREQLDEVCRLVSERLERADWDLVYQSRSGPPSQPWLEPALSGHLRGLAEQSGVEDVVVVPIGFVCEHMETVYDLDVEAQSLCDELELNMVRASVAGGHPRFVQMIRELVEERLSDATDRPALGNLGPWPDQCPDDCCRPT